MACWAISWMDPDSSSVAITVASMRRAVSDEALEADAIRLSVSPAICPSTGQRSRSLLDGFDHLTALATSNDMTCETTLARSASLRDENRCRLERIECTAQVLPAELRIRASSPISAFCSTLYRHDSA